MSSWEHKVAIQRRYCERKRHLGTEMRLHTRPSKYSRDDVGMPACTDVATATKPKFSRLIAYSLELSFVRRICQPYVYHAGSLPHDFILHPQEYLDLVAKRIFPNGDLGGP